MTTAGKEFGHEAPKLAREIAVQLRTLASLCKAPSAAEHHAREAAEWDERAARWEALDGSGPRTADARPE